MPALESDLRRQLENVIIQARDVAEGAARSALQKRAVDVAEPFSHFGPKEKELRNRLRARGRQAGDIRNADKKQSLDQLTQELAYEFWHRMLFARFLAENNLLMHPDGVAVSLEECEELAKDATPPASNGFVLAARFASTMLPQIFRTDDVLLEIDFAPEQRLALEKLLASLPRQTFEADDSLGWVYQFWQTAEKKRVNDTGDKIDGRTLPAVTQLFTEHYMVEFLLHNTIGAWWCGRRGIQGPPGSAGIPAGQSPVEMEYLRWRDDGIPAAGKFEGWPKTLAEFTMLDPCCGSGHFLVSGFNLLVPLRMHDEKLTAEKACEAVLRDNLFGLELDPRCTQIAAFALALAAWKYPDAGGYRPLPPLNIACSGHGVTGKKEEWLALAIRDEKLKSGMEKLFDLFAKAQDLGSLLDPSRTRTDLFSADFSRLHSLLDTALKNERVRQNAETIAIGVSAMGLAKAAELLVKPVTLTVTNVPYLKRGKQSQSLLDFCDEHHAEAKMDLATAFLERSFRFSTVGTTVALVTPQNWLFLQGYKSLRERLLREKRWNLLARLGAGAFETISGEVVNVILYIAENKQCSTTHQCAGIDAVAEKSASGKASLLKAAQLVVLNQIEQLRNPDSRVVLGALSNEMLLAQYAIALSGLSAGDAISFNRFFWEVAELGDEWEYLQGTVDTTVHYGGREEIIFWQQERGRMNQLAESVRHLNHAAQNWLRGKPSWGKRGVCVNQMGDLSCTIYLGDRYDCNATAIIPKDEADLLPIWVFCSSTEYREAVQNIDQSIKKTPHTLLKVPFDLEYWKGVASEKYAAGLPLPCITNPGQWLFAGDIQSCDDPLQVAVARLLGYRWPEQPKTADAIDKLADRDGILCLPGVRGEAAAAERLLGGLHAAYGKNWSDSVLHKLLSDAGCKAGTTLDDWLRNQFFEQHCKRFQNRPFIWHVWDGRKDGFSALLNYHKLDHKALENLTYAYLGDWITAQSKSDKPGADLRLGAAQDLQGRLKLILAGEPPYDIFVRWKPIHEQAIGWQPDLNDGVRENIRPFIVAGVLKKEPKSLLKDKDRGKEPEQDKDKDDYPWFWNGKEFIGDRVNDVHLTNEKKSAARSRKKGAK